MAEGRQTKETSIYSPTVQRTLRLCRPLQRLALPEGEDICTCTIITTDANELVRPVHDRMPPAITEKTDFDPRLDPKNQNIDKLKAILKSYPSEELAMYDVTPAFNSPKNNSPDNIKPI